VTHVPGGSGRFRDPRPPTVWLLGESQSMGHQLSKQATNCSTPWQNPVPPSHQLPIPHGRYLGLGLTSHLGRDNPPNLGRWLGFQRTRAHTDPLCGRGPGSRRRSSSEIRTPPFLSSWAPAIAGAWAPRACPDLPSLPGPAPTPPGCPLSPRSNSPQSPAAARCRSHGPQPTATPGQRIDTWQSRRGGFLGTKASR
jgi:hypothetical protein